MVEGRIPAELQGTFFRNGPGLMQNGAYKVDHMFDGDGVMASLAFKDGRAFFRSKFVHTREFVEERRQKRAIYRGAFTRGSPAGTVFNPFSMSSKNVANTGVFCWGDRVFALYESGLPYEMRASDLSTVGESRLDDSFLSEVCQAHYRKVTQRDGEERYVTFGVDKKLMDAKVTFHEYTTKGRLLHTRSVDIPGGALAFFHDLAVTEHFYVLHKNPTRLDFGKYFTEHALGKIGLAECILHDPRLGCEVLLIPRQGARMHVPADRVARFGGPSLFVFHLFNAYEVVQGGRNHVVVDCITWDKLDFGRTGRVDAVREADYQDGCNVYKPTRVVCDLAAGAATFTHMTQHTGEYPMVNQAQAGRPHRHMYYAGSYEEGVHGPTQAVVKLTVDPLAGVAGPFSEAAVGRQAWRPGPRTFVSEISVRPKAGAVDEDDTWLIGYLHNGDAMKAEVFILDGKRVSEGPVARIRLPVYLPVGLHSCWSDDVFMEAEGELVAPGQVYKSNVHEQQF